MSINKMLFEVDFHSFPKGRPIAAWASNCFLCERV